MAVVLKSTASSYVAALTVLRRARVEADFAGLHVDQFVGVCRSARSHDSMMA